MFGISQLSRLKMWSRWLFARRRSAIKAKTNKISKRKTNKKKKTNKTS